jgi:ferredoxin-NADP reductase
MTHQFYIKEVEHPATDTVTLHFDRPPNFQEYLPGQHVQLSVNLGGNRSPAATPSALLLTWISILP